MQHREVGPKDRQRFPTCGKNLRGEGSCWICDVVIPKLKQGDAAKRKRAAALEPGVKFAVQIAPVDDKGRFGKPQLWFCPHGKKKSLSIVLMKVLKSTKRDYISFKNGYNLNIERTGTGKFDTNYGPIIPNDDPSPVPRHIAEAILPFEELIRPYSKEYQEAAYFGRDIESEQDEVEEDNFEETGPIAIPEAENDFAEQSLDGTDENQDAIETAMDDGTDFEEVAAAAGADDDGLGLDASVDDLGFEEVTADTTDDLSADASTTEELDALFGDDEPEPAPAPARRAATPAPAPARRPAPTPAAKPAPAAARKPAPAPAPAAARKPASAPAAPAPAARKPIPAPAKKGGK